MLNTQQPSIPAAQTGFQRWPRAFSDLPREHAFEPLRVAGRIPPELCGTLYWNGPGSFETFGARRPMWLDGDGAVTAVRIDGDRGRALGAAKMVQSRSYAAEQRAQRRLYSRWRLRAPRPFSEYFRGDTRNPGNTSVWALRGELYALCQAGLPIALDPDDLGTRGEHDFGGLVPRSLSAHASYCADRRAFYNFALHSGRTSSIELFEFRDDGTDRKLASIPIAGASFVHDFMVTSRYALFVVPPFRIEALPMLFNLRTLGESFRWRSEQATEVIVVPLDAPGALMRMELPACSVLHFANAFEEDGELIADAPVSHDAMRTWRWLSGLAQGERNLRPDNSLARLRIDLGARRCTWEPLSDTVEEQPRIAPHYENRRQRYVYMAAFTGDNTGITNALRKRDLSTGSATLIEFGSETYASEAAFVPRSNSRGEDDGYLLTMVYDGNSHTSYLAIVDAACLEQGPVATLHFDHHIMPPFHGTWVDARWSGPHPVE